MHTAKVIGLRGKSPWSLLIRLRSPKYQHIATIIDNTFVYHSVLNGGVTVDEILWDEKDYDVIKEYKLTENEYFELLKEIKEKRNLSYSIKECCRVAQKDLGINILKDSINPNCVETATEWQVRLNKIPCSELYEIRTPDSYVNMVKNIKE